MRVKFFSPHLPFAGIGIPLLVNIKTLLDKLDDQEMEMTEAAKIIDSLLLVDGKPAGECVIEVGGEINLGRLLLYIPSVNAPSPKQVLRLLRFWIIL